MQGDLVMLVTALMETDLARALKKDASMSGGRRITWEPRRGGRALRMGLARRIALDVARGLAFLHGRKVGSPHGFLGLVQQPQLFVARKRKASQGGVWATGKWIRVMRGHAFALSCTMRGHATLHLSVCIRSCPVRILRTICGARPNSECARRSCTGT